MINGIGVGGGAGEWAKLAPLRILSVDIECAGRKVRCLPVTSCFIVLCPERASPAQCSEWGSLILKVDKKGS